MYIRGAGLPVNIKYARARKNADWAGLRCALVALIQSGVGGAGRAISTYFVGSCSKISCAR